MEKLISRKHTKKEIPRSQHTQTSGLINDEFLMFRKALRDYWITLEPNQKQNYDRIISGQRGIELTNMIQDLQKQVNRVSISENN